jgi:hypothetical protein
MRGIDFDGLWFMFAGLGGLLWILPGLILVSFLVMYVIGDIAGRRSGRRDPLLGAKVFLTLLATVGFETALAGAALLLGNFFESWDYGNAIKETGGLILGGGIVGCYGAFLYYARARLYGTDRVLRQAIGVNAIVTGLVFAFALTAALHISLNDSEDLHYPLSFTVVYLGANAACIAPLLARQPLHESDED